MRPLALPALAVGALALVAEVSGPSGTLPGPLPDFPQSLKRPAESSIPPDLAWGRPTVFVENQGQWTHPARYVARMGPLTAFLEDRGWIFTLEEGGKGPERLDPLRAFEEEDLHPEPVRGVGIRMCFEGDAHLPDLEAEGKLSGYHNYFLGNDPERWRSFVPLHTSVRYRSMYPGIDMRVREDKGRLEYDLLLAPGTDLSRVVVHVDGADGLAVESDGALVMTTALGPVRQPPPATWEVMSTGEKHCIECRYELLGKERFGFSVPAWEGDLALVVDPKLIWSTYLGGSGGDSVRGGALAVDGNGVITVAGSTGSLNFPTTPGVYRTQLQGQDIFASRLDPSRPGPQQLLWSTFLGGSGSDKQKFGYSGRIDLVGPTGTVTLGGLTHSNDFPTTAGAYSRAFNGGYSDCFIAQLNATGSKLLYGTYLGGGTHYDFVSTLAVEAGGAIVVGGYTYSPDFPLQGAFDSKFSLVEGFVSRLDPSKTGLQQLTWSTFLGGNYTDEVRSLRVDAKGLVTVTGTTDSPLFPTTPNAFSRQKYPALAGFVARLDPSQLGQQQLVWSTFFGQGRDLVVDSAGVVTVTGDSSSPTPTTPGAYSRDPAAHYGGFVARLDPSKQGTQQLVWSTFFGHGNLALSVGPSGVITVTGHCNRRLPTTPGAWDRTYNGANTDAFVAQLDATGSKLLSGTFLGGGDLNEAWAMATSPQGIVTVAGYTRSNDFPTTPGAWDTTFNGGSHDAFIARLQLMPDGVQRHGTSTRGCQGHPTIHALDDAQAGSTTFGLACTRVPAMAPGVLLVSALGLKNPLRVLGIDIWVDLRFTTAFALKPLKADDDNESIQKFGLPLWTKGMRFESQYVWFDPSCPKTPFCASEALSVLVR